MPFTSAWLVENKVIYVRFSGDITLDDVATIKMKFAAASATLPTEGLHVLTDVRDLNRMPGISAWTQLDILQRIPFGWVIFFGIRDEFLRLTISTVMQTFAIKTRTVDTLVQALDFLQSVDHTLPDLRARPISESESERLSASVG